MGDGANDAQKSIGVIAALLLAAGDIDTPAAPLWVKLACAAALTVGTTMGGWRIIRTVGRGIYRIQSVDGLAEPQAITTPAGRQLRPVGRSLPVTAPPPAEQSGRGWLLQYRRGLVVLDLLTAAGRTRGAVQVRLGAT